jgi:hypothetical protein
MIHADHVFVEYVLRIGYAYELETDARILIWCVQADQEEHSCKYTKA